MPTLAIGFISQLADGSWTPVCATAQAAGAYVSDIRLPVRANRVALPVLVDLPAQPPRPAVTLADGKRITWRLNRNVYVCERVEYASVVACIRALAVADTDVAALQALPATTATWASDGGTGE